MNRFSLLLISMILSSCQAQPDNSIAECPIPSKGTKEIIGTMTTLGDNKAYPEERERQVEFQNFNIDIFEVTNADFRKFVNATNYVTTAEKPQPGSGKPGGAVFKTPTAKNPNWWQFVDGANWREPEGSGSSIKGRDHFPVVQISLIDARAYADWANRSLPTEGQWEYAARAGSTTTYVWGEERTPNGKEQANTWQGAFPIQNTQKDGYFGLAPVGCYEPNNYGLYDMIGNVWEWTLSEYKETATPNSYTIKGGSYLCAENYCARYRAPARQSQEADFSTNHIGFRTVSATDN